MLALYLLALGGAGGLVGAFAHHLLNAHGYMPGLFRLEIVVTGGLAAAYMAIQLLYMTFLRLVFPTRSATPLFGEMLSQAAALVLLPYLVHVTIPWPHEFLAKVEPLIFLGTFGAGHVFFKLVSFYGAIRGTPGGRLGAVGWLAASACCMAGVYGAFQTWIGASDVTRPAASAESALYRVGAAYAEARRLPEGAALVAAIKTYEGQHLTFRWAPLAVAQDGEPGTIYVTVEVAGKETRRYEQQVELDPEGWAEMRVPATPDPDAEHRLPEAPHACSVMWTREPEPPWKVILGLRPSVSSHQEMLLSGPFEHQAAQGAEQPNLIVVAVDGLGTEHLSFSGYPREVTPRLDQLAYTGESFLNAYTPAPEAPAALMTLLTGLNPLRHGYLGSHRGPLPEPHVTLAEALRRQHYSTAAFVEGEGENDDLVCGSGFEWGFEFYDPTFPLPEGEEEGPADSAVTLEKARQWIAAHPHTKYFLFVRLSELAFPRLSLRHGRRFSEGRDPPPRDVYDTVLHYLDGALGDFVDAIRNGPGRNNTCLLVTSPYGLDFSDSRYGNPERLLSEASLRVPVFWLAPEGRRAQHVRVIGLEDVTPLLLETGGVVMDYPLDGVHCGQSNGAKEAVSMMGQPLVLSLRAGNWRFTWLSDTVPFAETGSNRGNVAGLYDLGAEGPPRDVAARYPEVITRYRRFLRDYLVRYNRVWAETPTPEGE